jgi:putative heme-binding domain-containing protein
MRLLLATFSLLCLAANIALAQPQLVPVPLVAETELLPPEEQQKLFHLPDGFEIQLVASDPDIGQPMQLNFDAKGRLWVTHSVEYPYPAQGEGVEPRDPRFPNIGEHPPRDRLTILSGIGADGRATSITHFAEGLNIPIGQVPLVSDDREAALCYSIPSIDLFTDLNGDGVATDADERQRLYGRFGNVDTHGNVSSFIRAIDGWIYSTHGFRNVSPVVGGDGHGFTMTSGNTFRFREDGSRIEQYTWGQVNPYGMTMDPWGNIYTADCHTMPLTCLIPGAYYDSFGAPHDGLGYGPNMIDHLHGSTGICGCAWYEADHYPSDYSGCIFLCNPVTGIVHRDRIAWRGSSPWAETQPEFITCDDGWFRPVDVKLGPDGALYIADFYNCIIGHYEVALDHPRRDRTHGRVWRVVYTGAENETTALPDLTLLSNAELIDKLGDDNMTVRLLATNLLVERMADERGQLTEDMVRMSRNAEENSEIKRVHAMWIATRRGWFGARLMFDALRDSSPLVQVHALRVLSQPWAAEARETIYEPRFDGQTAINLLLSSGVREFNYPENTPHVKRAAVDFTAKFPHPSNLPSLVDLLGDIPEDDTHLRHATLIAIREHINECELGEDSELWQTVRQQAAEHPEIMTQVALGARNEQGAALAFDRLPYVIRGSENRLQLVHHVARYADVFRLQSLVEMLSLYDSLDVAQELSEFEVVRRGLEERGMNPAIALGDWGQSLVTRLLAQEAPQGLDWVASPLPGNPPQHAAFVPQERPSGDGDPASQFFCSLPVGEQVTGVLQSDPFEIPATLQFFMAGHDGFPDQPLKGANFIRLRDAATGAVLMESSPPRNDLAQQVEWDLAEHAGRKGYLEIVDGDTADAYAWLAVGRFSIEELNPGAASPARQAAGLIAALKLTDMLPRLREMVGATDSPLSLRRQAAEAILAVAPDARLGVLTAVAGEPATGDDLRQSCFDSVIDPSEETRLSETLALVMRSVPAERQQALAEQLAGDALGGEALLKLISEGVASPRLLQTPVLLQRLQALNLPDFDARLADLTRDLPEPSAEIDALLRERIAGFEARGNQFDPERSLTLFKKHCGACHQVAGEGNRIGPQLEGIGSRGIARLLEDVLDPNRNVDAAFRTSVIATVDGQIITGLVRRDEGAVRIVANEKGEEIRIPIDEIDEQRISNLSLMPANTGSTVPADELYEILAWLMSQPKVEGAE